MNHFACIDWQRHRRTRKSATGHPNLQQSSVYLPRGKAKFFVWGKWTGWVGGWGVKQPSLVRFAVKKLCSFRESELGGVEVTDLSLFWGTKKLCSLGQTNSTQLLCPLSAQVALPLSSTKNAMKPVSARFTADKDCLLRQPRIPGARRMILAMISAGFTWSQAALPEFVRAALRWFHPSSWPHPRTRTCCPSSTLLLWSSGYHPPTVWNPTSCKKTVLITLWVSPPPKLANRMKDQNSYLDERTTAETPSSCSLSLDVPWTSKNLSTMSTARWIVVEGKFFMFANSTSQSSSMCLKHNVIESLKILFGEINFRIFCCDQRRTRRHFMTFRNQTCVSPNKGRTSSVEKGFSSCCSRPCPNW